MATAAPTTDPKTELAALTADAAKLRTKLEADKKTLGELQDERGRVAEGIAVGEIPPERASEMARRIEGMQASVEGGAALLGRVEARIAIVRPIVQQQDAAERLAKSQAELAALKTEGEAIAARINERLTAILTEDLPAFDAIRDKMEKEYVGQGLPGPIEANRLIHALVQGDVLVAETAVRKKNGWRRRSDIQLSLHNLWPVETRWP